MDRWGGIGVGGVEHGSRAGRAALIKVRKELNRNTEGVGSSSSMPLMFLLPCTWFPCLSREREDEVTSRVSYSSNL